MLLRWASFDHCSTGMRLTAGEYWYQGFTQKPQDHPQLIFSFAPSTENGVKIALFGVSGSEVKAKNASWLRETK